MERPMNCGGKLVIRGSGVGALLGIDPCIERLRRSLEQVAPTDATVLLSGETGTGKELAATAIHAHSPRARRPLVRLHCASLAQPMLESELFGHEPGAFPAAVARRMGRLEKAAGGTLFLDEISEFPCGAQAQLLRFLQDREFERVGGSETLRADVRVIAATRRNLREEVAAGRFREDLFYRLSIVHIELPALRGRRSDIRLLAGLLLAHFAEQHGRPVDGFTPEALDKLLSYPWPGNVRELENAIERAVVMAKERWIQPRHLELALDGRPPGVGTPLIPGSTLAEIERVAILRTLEAVGGSTSRAAAMLGISTRKIQYRIREYREVGLLGRSPSAEQRSSQ
jgi:DNA-binding NtrC family response regulator